MTMKMKMKTLPGRALRAASAALLAALGLLTANPAWAQAVKLRPLAPLYTDGKGSGMVRPEGIACGPEHVLVVADTGNARLLAYSVGTDAISPRSEIVAAQVAAPIKVQVGSGGEIFALDGKSRKIVRLGSGGEFKGYVEPGADEGLVVTRSFKLGKDGAVYILDILGARVLVLSLEGKTLRRIAFPKVYGSMSDLALDPGGNVYLLDSVRKTVLIAGKDAETAVALGANLSEDMDFPTAIAADAKGRLYLADQHGGGIVILGQDGAFRGRQSGPGWKDGVLRYPSDLCLDEAGTLFVADRQNNRVQPFAVTP